MQKSFLMAGALFFGFQLHSGHTFAQVKQHTHKAHVHGEAKLNVAVDGKVALFEFEIPGDAIFGFEHQPRTEAEKKKVQEELAFLRGAGSELIALPDGFKCEFSTKSMKSDLEPSEKDESHSHSHKHETPKKDETTKKKKHHHHHGHDHHSEQHSDVLVEYQVSCDKVVSGPVNILLSKRYSSIRRIRTQVLSDGASFGVTLTKAKHTLQIKGK